MCVRIENFLSMTSHIICFQRLPFSSWSVFCTSCSGWGIGSKIVLCKLRSNQRTSGVAKTRVAGQGWGSRIRAKGQGGGVRVMGEGQLTEEMVLLCFASLCSRRYSKSEGRLNKAIIISSRATWSYVCAVTVRRSYWWSYWCTINLYRQPHRKNSGRTNITYVIISSVMK